jgi:large subunit ribosomal protein L16
MSIKRKLKRQAKIWFQLAANKMVTKKPNQIRLGKGKGGTKYWVYAVKPGKIIIEAKGFNPTDIIYNLKKINSAFNITTSLKSKQKRWIL